MKITFILPIIDVCGGVRSTLELSNQLVSRGHDVSVVYPLIPSSNKSFSLNECSYVAWGTLLNIKKGNGLQWFDLKAKLLSPPTLSERWIPQGDVIVVTSWRNASQVNNYSTDKGEKFYFIRHYETWDGDPDKVKKTYDLPLHKIITSNWLKNCIKTNHKGPVDGPIPNGVNFKDFFMERNDFERYDPIRIGMLYRLDKFKGIDDGVKAFKIVKKQYPNIKMVLFGHPEQNNELKDLKDLGDFEFHVLPVKDELREIYNSLDIFVFSSCSEGYGNPPMESMACGSAVVSTNVGAVPDYSIDGKTILISPVHNPEALAENVIELIENENKRKKMAENGYLHIQNFNWEDSAKKLEKVFEKYI
jgi:glycosyltransferase involved in cell wall biosynthesis